MTGEAGPQLLGDVNSAGETANRTGGSIKTDQKGQLKGQ